MHGEWSVSGYHEIRRLGEGSAGRVVFAVHDDTDIPVAIKYLSARLYDDVEFTNRFRAEAQLLAEIRDPHLVRFYEYVESRHGAAIVMELINGMSLAQLIKAAGPTGPEAALTVLKGSLLGLAAAHLAGVVHRDYKPGNVLVRGDGVSKLADLGIAVRAGDDAPVAGTPAYMAPEQWRGSPVTPAADVYSATAVFYECLTGERPFPAKTLPQLAVAHRSAAIPVKRVPEPLRKLVALGMAKDPADRPASAAEFLERLEATADDAYGAGWDERGRNRLAERAAILALRLPTSREAGQGATALALTELGQGGRSVRRGLVAATGAAVAVLLGGGGVAVYAASHGTDRPRKPPLAAPSSPVDLSAFPSAGPSVDPSASPSEPTHTPSSGPPIFPVTEPATSGGGGTGSPSSVPSQGTVEEPRIQPEPGGNPTFRVTALKVDWVPQELTGVADIAVQANGRQKVTVLISYKYGDTAVGSDSKSDFGKTSYAFSSSYVFNSNCEARTVTVTAQPGNVTDTATIPAAEPCSSPKGADPK